MYQACVIMLMAVTYFLAPFANIVTITFSALIMIELLNVVSEVRKIKRTMVISICLTLGVYFTSIVLLRQYFQLSYVDFRFLV